LKRGYGGGIGKGHLYAVNPNTPYGHLPVGAAFFPPLYDGDSLSKEAFAIMEAYAHLFAAAPDLLMTLERIAGATLDEFADCDFAQAFTAFQEWAKAAIAKAKP